MEVPRIAFGVESIDSHLQAGIPVGSVLAIMGNPGLPKQVIGLKFIGEGIKENSCKSLVVSTKSTYSQLQASAQMLNIPLHQCSVLDAAHWRIRRVNQKLKSGADYEIPNLSDLNSLLSKIMQACNDRSISRVFFDSPSSLFLYSTPGPEQIFRFFELLTAFTRSNKITLCYSMEYQVHTQQIVATMQFLSDGVIELSVEDQQLWGEVKFLSLTPVMNSKFTMRM